MAKLLDPKFLMFHARNPHVLDRLIELAREWADAGHTRIGMQMLFEVLRWEYGLQTEGDAFKINNNYASYYTRMIQAIDPELGDMFETRVMKAA